MDGRTSIPRPTTPRTGSPSASSPSASTRWASRDGFRLRRRDEPGRRVARDGLGNDEGEPGVDRAFDRVERDDRGPEQPRDPRRGHAELQGEDRKVYGDHDDDS